jgi:CheY-like chemotaxis protein
MESRFRVTAAGRQAWQSKDRAVPSDYRFILWMLDLHGHERTAGFIGQFPEQFLEDCLAELEEVRLIERASEDTPSPPAAPPSVVAVSQEELPRIQATLASGGAYLSEERLRQYPPSAKPAAETTILVVEDDPDQLALADLRVSMAGYRVQVADSQRGMLRSLADKGVPDLLLLDVMLPDGHGFEMLPRLRRLPTFAGLPIVLLTAKAEPADIAEGLRRGADGYVTKPYSKNVLATVIDRVLRRGAS